MSDVFNSPTSSLAINGLSTSEIEQLRLDLAASREEVQRIARCLQEAEDDTDKAEAEVTRLRQALEAPKLKDKCPVCGDQGCSNCDINLASTEVTRLRGAIENMPRSDTTAISMPSQMYMARGWDAAVDKIQAALAQPEPGKPA